MKLLIIFKFKKLNLKMDKDDVKNKTNCPNINFNNNLIDTQNSKIEDNLEKTIKYESLISNTSILSCSNSYHKKINEIKRVIKNGININTCNIHSLPLNIICIDERKKICSQCALNDIHSNHQIITEKDFIINIDKLIDLFQEIDNNQIKYLSINNTINVKNILDNIFIKIKQLIDLVDETKDKIIKNINNQCEKIVDFLNKRKNEIEKKYQNNNFDMNNLRESALNWLQIVNKKLNQINDINEINIDLIKLIDDEQDKNISNLIRGGKQLKDRFIFAQESLKIINNLEQFKNNGLKVEPNNKILTNILDINRNNNQNDLLQDNIDINKIENNKDNNDENNKNNIKITLFNVEENYNLIKLLHLQKSEFDIKAKSKINKNIAIFDNLNNDISIKKPEKSLISIDGININEDTLLFSPHSIINHDNISSSKSSKKKVNNMQNSSIKKDSMSTNKDKQNTIEINNNNNINIKKPNCIITKKITGLNKIKDNNFNNNINNYKENRITNNIKKIQTKENKLKYFYKLNSEETLCTSYSRSPANRRNENYQSINMDKINWDNSKNKREKKIKVGLNNKMNNYFYKNKEYGNSSKVLNKKNNLSVRKNNILSRRSSKEKENLNNLNITSINKRILKINTNKLSLRNHKSKKSFSSLYSEQILLDSNNKKITNSGDKNEQFRENNIKLNVNNHYNNLYNINNYNNNNREKIKSIDISNYNNMNNINNIENIKNIDVNNNNSIINNNINIIKKNIMTNNNNNNNNINLIKNENGEIKTKKELNNIVLTQMRNLTPNFSRINMSGIGMQLICSYLHKNPNKNYKEMKLLGCNLVDDDLFLLVRTLLDHNINLLILNLSNNKIGDESASNILDLVKEHKTLKGLSLYNNLISDLLKEKLKEYTELGRENLHSIQLYI